MLVRSCPSHPVLVARRIELARCHNTLGAALLIATAGMSPSVHAQKLHALVVGDQSPAAGWGNYAPNITLDMTNMFAVVPPLSDQSPKLRVAA